MARSVFERHLVAAVERYPNLSIVGKPGHQYLKGILDVPDGSGAIGTSYSVEIKESPGYPKRFPEAFEVGGDIPIGADTHKGSDNHLCLTVDADEILQCSRGINLVDFIETVLIPHLAHQYFRKITGHYVQEYAHYSAGIKEFYEELLGTTDFDVWRTFFDAVFVNKIGRNDPCPCSNGKKYKHCHQPVGEKMKTIGREQVEKDFKELNVL